MYAGNAKRDIVDISYDITDDIADDIANVAENLCLLT